MAPVVNRPWSLVLHMKTMHAYTEPQAIAPLPRLYRRLQYPRSARAADFIIINSHSLRSEIERYLEVDPGKLRLIYEAVDHELFCPGDPEEARAQVKAHGVTKPFVLFVSSLWPYKNCDGLLRAWAQARAGLPGHQLVIVGPGRDEKYLAELHALAASLGIAGDLVFTGGVPLEDTVAFYRAADGVRVPVPERDLRPAHPGGHGLRLPGGHLRHQRDAGDRGRRRGAGRSARPGLHRPGHHRGGRAPGPAARRRAAPGRQFTWGATGAATLDVYREAYAKRKGHRG